MSRRSAKARMRRPASAEACSSGMGKGRTGEICLNLGRLILVVVALAAAMLAPRAIAQVPGTHWYRGNTHTHTINSDGDSAPDIVVRWYREHNYQFLFITDHEYVTDVTLLNALLGATNRFLVLPGQEVTQWSDDPQRSSARGLRPRGRGRQQRQNCLDATCVCRRAKREISVPSTITHGCGRRLHGCDLRSGCSDWKS
jgi:hypothetical protein